MKLRRSVTALAAASAFASPALADPNAPPPQVDVRAALGRVAPTIAAMQTTARLARLVLQWAREGGAPEAIACADEGLSRADVALRAARDHAARAEGAWAHGELAAARRELVLVSWANDASRLAATMVDGCLGGGEGTTVQVLAPQVAKR